MESKRLGIFDSSLQKTNLWLKEVERGIHSDNRLKAYATLRAVLHALRACLPVEETAKFAAQMPLFISGIFYDGWKPRHKPLWRTREDFYRFIRDCLRNQSDLDPALATHAVIRLLGSHFTRGEMAGIRGVLPKEIRQIWDEALAPEPAPAAARRPARAGGWMRGEGGSRRWTPLPEAANAQAQARRG